MIGSCDQFSRKIDNISRTKMSAIRNHFVNRNTVGICPETCIRQKLEVRLIDFLDKLEMETAADFGGMLSFFSNTVVDIGYCTGRCSDDQPKTIRQKIMADNVSNF